MLKYFKGYAESVMCDVIEICLLDPGLSPKKIYYFSYQKDKTTFEFCCCCCCCGTTACGMAATDGVEGEEGS